MIAVDDSDCVLNEGLARTHTGVINGSRLSVERALLPDGR